MRTFSGSRSKSSLATHSNNLYVSDASLQFIQSDIDKMNTIISKIENNSKKVIELIPKNLSNEIENIHNKLNKINKSYSSFDFKKIQSEVEITNDTIYDLQNKMQNLFNRSNYIKLKDEINESSLMNFKNRVLNQTNQQCTDLYLYIDSELKRKINQFSNSQNSPPNVNHVPHFEIPSTQVIYCQKKVPASEKEKIILTIKDQTTRLSDIYSRYSTLRTSNKQKIDHDDMNSLIKKQKNDSKILNELTNQFNILLMNNKVNSNYMQNTNISDEEEDLFDVVDSEQLESFDNQAKKMLSNSKEKLKNVKKRISEEIQMIRARLDLLENKINEYGDFNGEKNDMLTHINLKVDNILNFDHPTHSENERNEKLAELYLNLRSNILKSLVDSSLDSLRKSMRYLRFQGSLI